METFPRGPSQSCGKVVAIDAVRSLGKCTMRADDGEHSSCEGALCGKVLVAHQIGSIRALGCRSGTDRVIGRIPATSPDHRLLHGVHANVYV